VHAQSSQKEQSIRIQSSGGLSEEDIQNMVRDAESYAEKDKERKAAVEAKNEAETAIYSAEKSLADYKDKVSMTWGDLHTVESKEKQRSCRE